MPDAAQTFISLYDEDDEDDEGDEDAAKVG